MPIPVIDLAKLPEAIRASRAGLLRPKRIQFRLRRTFRETASPMRGQRPGTLGGCPREILREAPQLRQNPKPFAVKSEVKNETTHIGS